MTDIFISYPREEEQRVRQLVAALKQRERQVWVDWGSIPPSAEWKVEILSGIEGADVFVAFLTRSYVHSAACAEELAHAVRHNKRIVPIAAENLEGPEVPPALALLNWLWWRGEEDIETISDRLIQAIEIDLEWLRAHTRLLVRAREWEHGARDSSLLLRGRDLAVMENWLATKHVDPTTTPEQIQYIVHSRYSANRRQRTLVGAISLALLITVVLAVTAEIQRREAVKQADISLTRQLAAQSVLVRERDVDQLQYAALLAAEGVRRSIARGVRVQEPEQALRAALDVLPGQVLNIADMHDGVVARDGVSFFARDSKALPRLHWLDGSGMAQELPHAGEKVEKAVFSADGGFLATATAEGSVRLWSARSWQQLSQHKMSHAISALGVSRDAFAAAGNGIVIVWEVQNGNEIASLYVGHPVDTLALLHDDSGRLAVALAEPTGKISIKDVKTGEPVTVLNVGNTVRAISLTPDGRKLIVEQQQQNAVVYEPEEGTTQIPTPEGRTFKVWEINEWREIDIEGGAWVGPELGRNVSLAPGAIDFESKWLAAGSVYRGVQIWDLDTGRRIIWLDDIDFVSALAFSGDGRRLATGTDNGTVSIWEIESRRRISTFSTEGPIRSVTFDQGGQNIVVHGGGSMVGVWRIGQEAVTLAEREGRDLEFTTTGQLSLLSGGIRTLLDVNTGIILSQEKIASEEALEHPGSGARSLDGRFGATTQGAGEIEVKDTGTGTVLARFSPGVDISAIFLSPDGKWLVIEDSADKVSVWEAATGRRIIEPFEYYDDYDVQFSPNGKFLATNDGTERINIWSLPEGRVAATLEHPGESMDCLNFAAAGAWLITEARVDDERHDYTVRLWRADSWVRAPFIGDDATAVLLSPDGRLVAVGYKDGRMALLEADTGVTLGTSIVHDTAVTELSFSSDGRWLAVATKDRVQVFETQSGNDIARLRTRGDVRSMLFSEDGRWLAVAAWEATEVWRLHPEELLAEACVRIKRDLTEAEWHTAFGQVARRPTCQR
jgi:WD40 repeat protein